MRQQEGSKETFREDDDQRGGGRPGLLCPAPPPSPVSPRGPGRSRHQPALGVRASANPSPPAAAPPVPSRSRAPGRPPKSSPPGCRRREACSLRRGAAAKCPAGTGPEVLRASHERARDRTTELTKHSKSRAPERATSRGRAAPPVSSRSRIGALRVACQSPSNPGVKAKLCGEKRGEGGRPQRTTRTSPSARTLDPGLRGHVDNPRACAISSASPAPPSADPRLPERLGESGGQGRKSWLEGALRAVHVREQRPILSALLEPRLCDSCILRQLPPKVHVRYVVKVSGCVI
ncbi:uncharacterized protein LOC132680590 [Panthera onca]